MVGGRALAELRRRAGWREPRPHRALPGGGAGGGPAPGFLRPAQAWAKAGASLRLCFQPRAGGPAPPFVPRSCFWEREAPRSPGASSFFAQNVKEGLGRSLTPRPQPSRTRSLSAPFLFAAKPAGTGGNILQSVPLPWDAEPPSSTDDYFLGGGDILMA